MIEKAAYLSDNRVTNIYKSFTHKMAAKTTCHRYGIKLGHYHPVYRNRSGVCVRVRTL